MKKYELQIENGCVVNIPNVLSVEEAKRRINEMKGNFGCICTRNDNPSEIAKRATEGMNFIKIATHYVVLGQKHYTEEEMQEFENKGWTANYEKLAKNLRIYNEKEYFYGRFNSNRHLHSQVVFIDLNTRRAYTKQEMIDLGYFKGSAINNTRGDFDGLKIRLDTIVGV